MSPTIITLDPQSDLTLEVSTHHFRVSRSTLAISSPIFNAMLRGPFSESSSSSIPLPDDDPAALHIILLIIHLRFAQVPRTFPFFEVLVELAVLIDKYDWRAVVQPFWRDWVEPEVARSLHHRGKEEWLFVTWVFGLKAEFAELIEALVREIQIDDEEEAGNKDLKAVDHTGSTETQTEPDSAEHDEHKSISESLTISYLNTLRLPPNALPIILHARTRAIRTLLDHCHSKASALRPPVPSSPSPSQTYCTHNTPACDAFMHASLLRHLHKQSLWPVPTSNSFHYSYNELSATLSRICIHQYPPEYRMTGTRNHEACVTKFWNPVPNPTFLIWDREMETLDEAMDEHAKQLGGHVRTLAEDFPTIPSAGAGPR